MTGESLADLPDDIYNLTLRSTLSSVTSYSLCDRQTSREVSTVARFWVGRRPTSCTFVSNAAHRAPRSPARALSRRRSIAAVGAAVGWRVLVGGF